MKATNITNERFNKLVGLRQHHKDSHGMWLWLFKCDCGKETVGYPRDVRLGKKCSCGCMGQVIKPEPTPWTPKTFEEQTVYNSWVQMRDRCNNLNREDYHRYGGRGITYCSLWEHFPNFKQSLGPKPTLEHSLDRIDNNGNYEPGNCRWATKKEQANNRG